MKTHTIALVCFIAAALAAAAIVVTSQSAPAPASTAEAGTLVLPTLAARINDAAEIRIHRGGTDAPFTYRRGGAASDPGAAWTLAEKDNYPVKIENIRALLIALSQLKIVEPKTSKPDLYPKIGVQDPTTEPAPAADPASPDAEPPTQPSLITITDAAGQSLGSIIIGTQKWTGGGAVPEVYVRRAGEAQSWLAAGRIDAPWDALAWIDRQIINIPRDKWKSVTITHADGESLTSSRVDPSQANFFLEKFPDGRQLTTPTAGDPLGSVFSSFTLDDVKSAAAFNPEQLATAPRTTGITFDGLALTARTIEADDKHWVILEAAATNPDENPDSTTLANDLNSKLVGWAFAIPDFKAKTLRTRWSDLLKPVSPPANMPEPAGEEPVAPENSTP